MPVEFGRILPDPTRSHACDHISDLLSGKYAANELNVHPK